jgi:peptide-N4-(N-acetyl-beta-glucosaminyl)asparagine amidase
MISLTLVQTSKLPSPTTFSKAKSVWPRPEDSIGMWYRKMGRNDCWEAKGPARDTFAQIAKEIKTYLNRCSDPVAYPVTWSIYMIGKTKDSAMPTVMFCCVERNSRKKVRKMIADSGILGEYPGIITGDCSSAPDCDRPVQLAGNETSRYDLQNTLLDSGSDVLYTPSENILGSQIFIKTKDGNGHSLRKATAGLVFQLGDRYFVSTVAHASMEPIELPSQGGQIGDDFEFDIDGESDYGEDIDVPINVNEKGMMSLTFPSSTDPSLPTNSMREVLTGHSSSVSEKEGAFSSVARTKTTSAFERDERALGGFMNKSLELLGDLAVSSAVGRDTGLDYALAEIKRPDVQKINAIRLSGGEVLYPSNISTKLTDTNVLAVTGSCGLLGGTLSGTPSFLRLPHSKDFQEVWTVRLAGCLEEGDCGSLVVDASTGDIYGHIVAGSPESGVAYIIPAYHIYDHLKQNFDPELKLSKKTAASDAQDSKEGPAVSAPKFHPFRSAWTMLERYWPSVPRVMCYYKNYQHRRRLHFLMERLQAQRHFEYTPANRRRRALQVLERTDSHWGRYVTLVAGIGFFTDSYNVSLLSS